MTYFLLNFIFIFLTKSSSQTFQLFDIFLNILVLIQGLMHLFFISDWEFGNFKNILFWTGCSQLTWNLLPHTNFADALLSMKLSRCSCFYHLSFAILSLSLGLIVLRRIFFICESKAFVLFAIIWTDLIRQGWLFIWSFPKNCLHFFLSLRVVINCVLGFGQFLMWVKLFPKFAILDAGPILCLLIKILADNLQ